MWNESNQTQLSLSALHILFPATRCIRHGTHAHSRYIAYHVSKCRVDLTRSPVGEIIHYTTSSRSTAVSPLMFLLSCTYWSEIPHKMPLHSALKRQTVQQANPTANIHKQQIVVLMRRSLTYVIVTSRRPSESRQRKSVPLSFKGYPSQWDVHND